MYPSDSLGAVFLDSAFSSISWFQWKGFSSFLRRSLTSRKQNMQPWDRFVGIKSFVALSGISVKQQFRPHWWRKLCQVCNLWHESCLLTFLGTTYPLKMMSSSNMRQFIVATGSNLRMPHEKLLPVKVIWVTMNFGMTIFKPLTLFGNCSEVGHPLNISWGKVGSPLKDFRNFLIEFFLNMRMCGSKVEYEANWVGCLKHSRQHDYPKPFYLVTCTLGCFPDTDRQFDFEYDHKQCILDQSQCITPGPLLGKFLATQGQMPHTGKLASFSQLIRQTSENQCPGGSVVQTKHNIWRIKQNEGISAKLNALLSAVYQGRQYGCTCLARAYALAGNFSTSTGTQYWLDTTDLM